MKLAQALAIAVALASSAAFAAQVTQDGEILKIDKATSMATIKHGPPKEQPNAPKRDFTYDYKVPAAMLNSLSSGDNVTFVADDNGTNGKDWTVTKIDKR